MTPPSASPTPRAALGATLLRLLLTVLFSLALMEGLARTLGFTPWDPTPAPIRIEPGGSLFEPDPVLGYRHRAGRFRIFQEPLRFSVHHGADGLRVTSDAPLEDDRRPGLWIFGGSFTHGWTVDDHESFPWLLQARLPGYRVRNFGVNGYGTLHALLQLDAALATGPPPALVVIAYGSFHDRRNVFSRERRKIIVPWRHLGSLRQPAARLGSDDELTIEMTDTPYTPVPGMESLAVVNLAEIAFDRLEARWLQEQDVTFALLGRIAERARRGGFALLVAGLSPDDATLAQLERCEAAGIATADVSHDWLDPELSQLPWDTHPNPRGQALYARGILAALRERGLVPAAALRGRGQGRDTTSMTSPTATQPASTTRM